MVLALVRLARRRIFHNEWLREGANAASAALGAFLLLLVLGTQILAWYWAVLLPLLALGIALYRVRRRIPSPYVVAQRIDRRMGLSDTLSTALFFASPENAGKASAELRRLQLAEAERAAQTVDARLAVPYRLPQGAYVAGALLLIASSLFALRYGLTDRLDLKPPLARILQQHFGLGDQQARAEPRRDDKVPVDNTLAPDQEQQAKPDSDPTQPQDTADDYAGDQAQKSAGKAGENNQNSQNQLDPDASDQDQPEPAEDADSNGRQNNSNSKDGQKNGKESQSGSSGDSKSSDQSLLSKMKEAMQNLLSSMQQQNQQNASNQNGKSGKGQQSPNKQQAQKGDKKNAQTNDSQDQQAADDGEQAQNAQGQSADKSDSALANKQPGSGAGNKDGGKDVKLAEQLAAMGKISEIIGKRAANVTGEVTVDVQTTSQQLHTGYQERRAEHVQAGAEINRDEIPVALESYVAQYFEQVRKQSSGPK